MVAVVQRHMPRRRSGHTTTVTIGAERFSLTANQGDGGDLGEVFIHWGKHGTSGAGLVNMYAVALSVGLQHRVPLADLIRADLTSASCPTAAPTIRRSRGSAPPSTTSPAAWPSTGCRTPIVPRSAYTRSPNASSKPAPGWAPKAPAGQASSRPGPRVHERVPRTNPLVPALEALTGGLEALTRGLEALTGGLEALTGGLEALTGGLEALTGGPRAPGTT
jgi:hypothetical protein